MDTGGADERRRPIVSATSAGVGHRSNLSSHLLPPTVPTSTSSSTGGRPMHRSASASFDGSSRQLTPRQLRSYEQSDGITIESGYADAHRDQRRPVLLTTPRQPYSIADRSPIPRSISTRPIDAVAIPNWAATVLEGDSNDDHKPADSASPPSTSSASTPALTATTPSLVRRASLAVFQSIAMQKLTREQAAGNELALDEWMKQMLQVVEGQEEIPPLDLRGDGAAALLSEYVSATLEIEVTHLRAVQVLSSPSSSNMHASTSSVPSAVAMKLTTNSNPDNRFRTKVSGDAVSLILDTGVSPPRLVGVVKVFSSHRTFEQELLAISRMHAWLETDQRTDAVEKPTEAAQATLSVRLNASPPPAGNLVLKVPKPLGAHFALTPSGKGGVLVMAAAEGSPLDDLFIGLSSKRANNASPADYEPAWAELKDAIGLTATAFFQLHTIPKGSGGNVRKRFLQKYITQLSNILTRIKEKLANPDPNNPATTLNATYLERFSHYSALFDMDQLQERLQPIIDAALAHRGLACVAHGDAHCGNIFYCQTSKVITLIDVPTVNSSVGDRGEPIGCAARDIANVYQKIAVTGAKYNCNAQEIHHLQIHFLDAYEKQFASHGTNSPLTMETFHFFHLRSVLGEFHRAVQYHTLDTPVLAAVNTALMQAEAFLQRKLARLAPTPSAPGTPAPKVNGNGPLSSPTASGASRDNGDEDDLIDDRLAMLLLNEERAQEKLLEEELLKKEIELAEIREQDQLAEAAPQGEVDDEDILFDDEEAEEVEVRAKRLHRHRDSIYSLSPTNQKRLLAGIGVLQAESDGLFARQQSSMEPPSTTVPFSNPLLSGGSINGGRILVVLGAPLKADMQTPDVWLESRLKHAVSIFYRTQLGLSALMLSGGRSSGMEVSIAKVMERWLRPFGIRSMSSRFTLLNEDMSSLGSAESYTRDLISQAFCIRSLLRMRGFRHGNLLIITSDFQLAAVSMVFNRIFKSSCGLITLEYVGSPTNRAYAPDTRVESARLKELPALMKELRVSYLNGTPYGNCSLLDACRAGSLQLLKLMCEIDTMNRENVANGTLHMSSNAMMINTEKDPLGCSPLHIAAEAGFTDCCEYLLQRGADPNARSTLGATPLHFATAMSRLEVVQLLLAYGGGPSRTLSGVCGRGQDRDCWNGSKRPCDMHKDESIGQQQQQSTHELQDLQPARSIITLLVQPESTSLAEANEDIRREHELFIRKLRLARGLSVGSNDRGMSRSNSRSNLNASPLPPTAHDDESSAISSGTATLPVDANTTVAITPLLSHRPTSLSLISPISAYPGLHNKRIILLRHSESLWNVNGSRRVRGLIDTTLTNTGVKQAKTLGNLLQKTGALQRLGIRLICVSPLTRTLQTYMLAVRWYLDLFPSTPPAPASTTDSGGSSNPNSNPSSPAPASSTAAATPCSPIRVCIRHELAEQLLSTGTIGRSPEHLKKDFDDPSLDFSQLPPVWWYSPPRDDLVASSPKDAAAAAAAAATAADDKRPPSPTLANTRVYLKREPLENVRIRTHQFLHWLEKQPETNVLVVGHGTWFRYLVDTDDLHPDLFKNNLAAWRL